MLSAQDSTRVSGSFQGSFREIVPLLEQRANVRIFYNPRQTDSLKININASELPLSDFFAQAFAGTDLKFSIDNARNVFISEGREIFTTLPDDFFGTRPVLRRKTFDYSDYERMEQRRKIAESKVWTVGTFTENLKGNATMAGVVKDEKTGEPLVGVSVFIKEPFTGTTTDQFGYFSLTIAKGRHEVYFQSMGMKTTLRRVMLYGNGKLNVEMEEEITPLKEVVVESDRDALVRSFQMGTEKLDIKTMKQIPLALGETDIMKVVLTLPGVQTVGEGTVGLNVRGGASNQNLILFNDAVIYNPSHLFGFFSTFNPDMLKNVELYKSAVNAEFGGRLSSVMDIHSREGNLKKFSGSGGLSPVTGRITLEGPIKKDKTSIIVGGRTTYSNWLLRQLNDRQLRRSTASFHDLAGNISHKINDNNQLYASGYYSRDEFNLGTDTSYQYTDRNASLKWKHLFNNKLYSVVTGGFSHYTFRIRSDENPVEAFKLNFGIKQANLKADFSFFPNPKHSLMAGISTVRYDIDPGDLLPIGSESSIIPDKLQSEQGLESAIYVSDQFEINQQWSLYAGLRFSVYHYLGPRDVFTYQPGTSKEPYTITDTVRYHGGVIRSYGGAEPRISVRYSPTKNSAIKFSYNRMRQYIQMLSNTAAINPTDVWKLSDDHIRPQIGDQFSLGFYQYLRGNQVEASVEGYYKTTTDGIDFKNGAQLLLNKQLETDVISTQGKAYGLEFLLKKNTGKVNGWISYTYSRSFLRTRSPYRAETVSGGVYYPSNFDKPHAFNFIGNYKFNRRVNFSTNVVYSTGRPITIPIAKFEIDGTTRLEYVNRNQERMRNYFRTDISLNFEGNHKIKKLAHSSWTIAVYNLTGRKNPFSVFFASEGNQIKGYQLSIFARPIPTITYNFKF